MGRFPDALCDRGAPRLRRGATSAGGYEGPFLGPPSLKEDSMAGARLVGKVAIVTGAGSRAEGIGNGRAAAILFAREGAKVLLVDQQREAAEATRALIAAEGGEAAVLAADVTHGD